MSSSKTFNCIFCKESFDSKEDLQIHFRKHGDPKFNQSQKNKVKPQNETQAPTEKRGDETEMVSCDVCTEVFPTISKAITHKHKVHPDHDAKYFCPWCGKLFTMKHLYNKHLQSNHTETKNESHDDVTNFHCDSCNVDFFIPSAMLYHNKFFHRQDTDLPSIGQSKKLKMVNQEVLQIYYCAFCGDEYDNKVNLHKHMVDDHGDENQSPEDVLRCPLCEAIFYHLDAYELHLTFHSTDDLYSEKNEIFEQITEFSLETVSPITEKVENIEPQDAETALNTVGIDKFLEMAMDTTTPKKSKKHKKHKKSKKSAITLDEFLNMNKDVFGEGIDIQGVEEVPTQVVAKRLKVNKINKLPTAKLKMMGNTNLEKLKRQGIVVKPSKKQPIQTFKVGQSIPTKPEMGKQAINKPSTSLKSPDEVFLKLLNQNNSQIKIIKKSAQQDNAAELDQTELSDVDNREDKTPASPENITVECDIMQSGYTSSETDVKDDYGEKEKALSPKDSSLIETDAQKNEEHSDCESENHECSNELINDNLESLGTKKIHNVSKTDTDIVNHDNVPSESCENTSIKSNNSIKTIGLPVNDKEKRGSDDFLNKTQTDEDFDNTSNSNLKETASSSKSSLNALKRLSHLITVKPVTSKENSPSYLHENILIKKDMPDSDVDDDENVTNTSLNQGETSSKLLQDVKETAIKPLEALKNISKNVTIKPLAHSPKRNTDSNEHKDHSETLVRSNAKTNNSNQMTQICSLKSDGNQPQSSKHSVKVCNNSIPLNQSDKTKLNKNDSEKKGYQSNANLLKHLTNITAKPVSSGTKNVPITGNSSLNSNNNIGQTHVTHKTVKKEEQKQEIEIFNIDDSDSDEADKHNSTLAGSSFSKNTPTESLQNKSIDKLKSIGKNVTIKTINQHSPQANKNVSKQIINMEESQHTEIHDGMSDFSDEDEDKNTLTPKNVNQIQYPTNANISNALKNLGKHITIKSRNSSPITLGNSKETRSNLHDSNDIDYAADSDNDSVPGRVKITEVQEDHASEDEMTEQDKNADNFDHADNVTVQSPRETNSDTDNYINDDTDGELSDLESQIQTNKLLKSELKFQKPKLDVKNICKDLNIKTIKKCQETDTFKKINQGIQNNFNKELSIKPYKQINSDCSNEFTQNKKNIITNASRSTNQALKQNLATNNQMSTINKEVTVKTFQTKTVIQEITTTVTKTIKTVNQTVKQEFQSTSQTSQPVKLQKIQGMKSNQQIKNFQGVTVRQATPVAGTKIRGATTVRPSIGTQVRPSNQLVPVRQTFNTPRPLNPRVSGVRKPIPTQIANQTSTSTGRPLKISPNASNTTKRSTEDTVGHFSCFKKPKESLIPVDIPNFDNQSEEPTVQFATTQRSNFTSATKTVKGNTVITQMKSEFSSSSQQLSKLSNLSGLKIVKTSQSKQAMQVEEKCELSASKRNTLEAIEKLQKQGLLVKKPRYDADNDSEHSDEEDQYTTEEPND